MVEGLILNQSSCCNTLKRIII